MKHNSYLPIAIVLAVSTSAASAQDSDLAKKLSNPVASLISVPFQWNYDHGIGPTDGDKVTLNIQPVIPISLNDNWNLISRTIVPVVWQDDIAGNSGTQFGLSDTTQSLFFSPKEPTAGGIIWGLGPALLFPTGTDDLLSTRKWGAGPTGVVLRQHGPWTYGALANHIWSFAGDESRSDVNSTLQTILFGLSGGLVPYLSAITVLLSCLQIKKVAIRLVMIFTSFSHSHA